ncbi:hypothetical protein GCM10010384_23700 [Streptomyces djakartensis]|uniref:ABC transporter permease n=1 Tax=Streptomyces djakartensis TaxID=68193 RepID=A0ABQ2ZL70_9ACTN|nr:hypothetical protein GCM10010384_23700 [Streptomyces djakartensis]
MCARARYGRAQGDTPKTRPLARFALAGTAATLLALATGASTHADGLDRTVWTGADLNVTPHDDPGGTDRRGKIRGTPDPRPTRLLRFGAGAARRAVDVGSVGSGRLYAAVAAGGFRRYATYRAATLAGVFTNTVFGVILVYTYMALWDEKPHLGGYDQAQAVTYVWLGQCLYATLAIQGGGAEKDLMERIRTGEIAVDLYRPADLQLWWLAGDVGRALFQMLGRGVIPFAFGAVFFPMALPTSVAPWAAFAVTLLLATVVSFAIRYLAALSVFWLMDGMGVSQALMVAGVFFSGMVLPLNAFPGAFGEVVRVLPWAAQIQMPADVLMGETGPLRAFAFQAAWAVALLAAGRLLQSAATRRVVVQGG